MRINKLKKCITNMAHVGVRFPKNLGIELIIKLKIGFIHLFLKRKNLKQNCKERKK